MVTFTGKIDTIPIYEDPLMEDSRILQGRKGVEGTTFIVASPKTTKLIYKTYLTKLRKDKLNYLNNL